MNKTGTFFKIFLPFIIFMAINIIVSMVTMVILLAKEITTNENGTAVFSYLENITYNQTYLQLSCLIFGIAAVCIFTIWYRRQFVRPLRSKPRKYWSGISFQVVIGLIFLAIGLQYAASLLTAGVSFVFPQWLESYNQMMDDVGYSAMSVMLGVYSIILAPIGEELAFRGLTMRYARKIFPFWAANILQALLFGIMHGDMIQGIYAFCVGLFFGWICKKGHSIKYSILLHILFNLFGTIFSDMFELTLGFNAVLFYVIGIILTIFAIFIFHLEITEKNALQKKRYQQESINE